MNLPLLILNIRQIQNCYLCGTTENLTNDHVPPKSFFPPPAPKDLITVRCCRKCNNEFSLDDEAMLIWISSVATINEKGKWILKNKIAPKLKKKIKLRENVKKHIKIETINLPTGPVRVPFSYMPDVRGDRFMVRLAKGFIRYFYPDYDYSNDKFKAQCVRPFNPDELQHLRNVVQMLPHDSRGDGVIDFWHRLPQEDDLGLWLFLFYEAAVLMVWHGKPELFSFSDSAPANVL